MLQEYVNGYIERWGLIPDGSTVIVGISGGPDSLCLAHILSGLSQRHGWRLVLAHFNHQLRGHEADADAEFVRGWAEAMGLEWRLGTQDVALAARTGGLSIETAARSCRYAFFGALRKEIGADRIALGHHLDDQAETVLMRLLRGTGTDGLAGMRPAREDGVVRPLLAVPRSEIEAYCRRQGLHPRQDLTNHEPQYTRNRLRLQLLPLLRAEYNPEVAEALGRTARWAAEDADCLNGLAEGLLKRHGVETSEGLELPIPVLRAEPPAIAKRALRQAVLKLRGTLEDLSADHLDALLDLMEKPTGKAFHILGLTFRVRYGRLVIAPETPPPESVPETALPVAEGSFRVPGGTLHLRRLPTADLREAWSLDPNRIVVDADRLRGMLTLRARRDGDRMVPFGMKGFKKLKDLMIDLRIPREQRGSIPVLCDGEKIVWVVGIRMDERVRVTEQTQKPLEIRWEVCCSTPDNVLE